MQSNLNNNNLSSNNLNNNLSSNNLNGGIKETIIRDVKLVEERLHQREEQHVQPVLTRDIEQREVRQVLQPMHETTVLPTQRATGTLAAEDRLINNDRVVEPVLVPEAQRIQGEAKVNIVQHAPIIEERLHKQVIEEVQPVLYRDVIQNKETIITQPIHERIIEAPVVIQETRQMVERGVIELGQTGAGSYGQSGLSGQQYGQTGLLNERGTGLSGQGLSGNGLTGQTGYNQSGLSGQGLKQMPEDTLGQQTQQRAQAL